MAGKPTTTDLVPFESFAIATRSEELAGVIRENIGDGGRMTPFDLDRVKVPTGGGKIWSIPSLDGEDDERELSGVIVAWRDARAFWEIPFASSGGGTPPDCSSQDSITGFGMYGVGSDLHPDGKCASCPMAQWGSKVNEKGEETKGQACKQMRVLFLLRPEALLPVALFAPPTSVSKLRKYFMRLSTQGLPYYGVVTGLSLGEAASNDGIAYSQVEPRMINRLTDENRDAVRAYADSLSSALDAVTITTEDVA